MTSDVLDLLTWLSDNQWAFWLVVNIGAFIAYRISLDTIVGLAGIIYPVSAAIATITFGQPRWVELIGVAGIMLTFTHIISARRCP